MEQHPWGKNEQYSLLLEGTKETDSTCRGGNRAQMKAAFSRDLQLMYNMNWQGGPKNYDLIADLNYS